MRKSKARGGKNSARKAKWVFLLLGTMLLIIVLDFAWIGLKKDPDPALVSSASSLVLPDGRILRLGADGSSLDLYDSGDHPIGRVPYRFPSFPLPAKTMTLDGVHHCLVLTDASGRNRVINLSSLQNPAPFPTLTGSK